LQEEVADLVRAIDARFSTPSWRAVEYLSEHHDRHDVAVLMRRADACLVTSLHDGMNLVAKEYIAARGDRHGVLVLSKFAGAARELPEACLINPYDIDGSADLLLESLRQPEERRRAAMQVMHEHVRRHDIHRWAMGLLSSLDDVARFRDARAFPGN
jgi:trehalose 6-phosphate synthase